VKTEQARRLKGDLKTYFPERGIYFIIEKAIELKKGELSRNWIEFARIAAVIFKTSMIMIWVFV
jgi:hypothetical protein